MNAELCLSQIIPKNIPLLYLEVGVLRATNLIRLASEYPLLELYGVDSYKGYVDTAHGNYFVSDKLSEYNRKIAETNIKNSKSSDRIHLIIEDSFDFCKRTPNASFDVVFLDRGFNFQGQMDDVIAWLPKVKSGGILCGHDAYTLEILEGAKQGLAHFGLKIQDIVGEEVWYTTISNTE